MALTPLPVQTSLDHRGAFGPRGAPLFPPRGTFEALGGRETVARLVDGLYGRIETDSVLRRAFNRDLTKEREKQKLFFEAWFAGAPTYFDAAWPCSFRSSSSITSLLQRLAAWP